MVKISMNGGVSKADNPYVPINPEEYLEEIAWFMQHGVNNFHIHFRDADGVDTLEQKYVQPQFQKLKEVFPNAMIGVGSPLLYCRTSEMRLDQVNRWTWKPDYISVNVCEEGSPQFSELLQKHGVPIEYGIFEMEDAEEFVRQGYIDSAFRIMIEVSGEADGPATVKKASAIYEYLHDRYPKGNYLIHGEDIFTWDVIRFADRQGVDWRIGFEDIDRDENGQLLTSNVALYQHAMEILEK
ncbi:MAG: 3-keto-5-aminohexanoate cleavage protein [Firmicutes bacterium]|nr:3-keto-5-aminohexanoate cleavage protein [Bacillota bacterium]